MERDVARLVALDQVLRLLLGGVMDITLEFQGRSYFPGDGSADPASLGIPPDVITTMEG
jgi:hypothetical protein